MRKLIMAMAGLLIAVSPAVAETAQPGWIADASTGCRVWNDHPRPKETITWSGRCENGLAQGNGVVQWFEDSRLAARMEGEMRDGKGNGYAVVTFVSGTRWDGDRFEGEYRDNQRNGHGVYTSANGKRSMVNGVTTSATATAF